MKSIEFTESEIWFLEKALLLIRDKTTLHMEYFRAKCDAEAESHYCEMTNKINRILDKIAGEEGQQ